MGMGYDTWIWITFIATAIPAAFFAGRWRGKLAIQHKLWDQNYIEALAMNYARRAIRNKNSEQWLGEIWEGTGHDKQARALVRAMELLPVVRAEAEMDHKNKPCHLAVVLDFPG